jgi:ADP-heptose:LPS heptosyltransferase
MIFRNFQSPGDIVMLTAVIRDLHTAYPGKYVTDVRTPCAHLWENNPYITPIPDENEGAMSLECHYPLIHRSNSEPWHFIHAFHQYLGEQLGVNIPPTEFKGHVPISDVEKEWISQVQEITGEAVPFWIVNAGGKFDFTAKWWAHERYQQVIDHCRGRILFVQVGEKGHHHPPLERVLDLREKTDLRQLIRLTYHAQGVLCPVTLLMHLAAAVETRPGMPRNRPCVVVAGGREPAQWEAYPHHQYIHTNGALRCCEQGGCWKSRVVPLGDGDEKDLPASMCIDVVHQRHPERSFRRERDEEVPEHARADADGRIVSDYLPRCLDLITAEEVIRRIQLYFDGGAISFLSEQERKVCAGTVPNLGWEEFR